MRLHGNNIKSISNLISKFETLELMRYNLIQIKKICTPCVQLDRKSLNLHKIQIIY